MADSPRLKKRDGRRVALGQEHERQYLIDQLQYVKDGLYFAELRVDSMLARLRAGFPEASRKGKGGKR